MKRDSKKNIFLPLLFFLCHFFLFGGEEHKAKQVLILGDSHAYALKDSFPGNEGPEKLQIHVKGISSSGLARRDFFDWPGFAQSEEAEGYDLYVVILGTNDGQNSHGSRDETFGTRDWEYLYTARLEYFIGALKEKGEVVWVSIPTVEEENLGRKTEYIQTLIDEVCQFHHIKQLDITPYLREELRREDGIHFNREGVEVLSLLLQSEMEEVFFQ